MVAGDDGGDELVKTGACRHGASNFDDGLG
jgi:hypothetical protein